MEQTENPIAAAVAAAGGGAALARQLGLRRQVVQAWVARRRVPEARLEDFFHFCSISEDSEVAAQVGAEAASKARIKVSPETWAALCAKPGGLTQARTDLLDALWPPGTVGAKRAAALDFYLERR